MKATSLGIISCITVLAAVLTVGLVPTPRAAAEESGIDQSKMIAVMVTLQAKPGEEELVEKQMKWFASECIKNEPGTLLYSIIKSENGDVHTMEIYKDEDAFKAHAATDHHAVNVEKLGDKIAKFDLKRFSVVNHPTR